MILELRLPASKPSEFLSILKSFFIQKLSDSKSGSSLRSASPDTRDARDFARFA